jgi:uncharacterized membrane protein YecN with MAPEG domain
MPITALYAALLAVLFLILSARTIGRRQAAKVEIGTATRDGADDRELLRRVRVHANCAEYLPIGVLLLGLAESLKAQPLALHVLGATLLIGRIIHAYGLSQSPHNLPLRVGGMVMTLTMIGLSAALCLWLAAPGALRF